MEQSEKLYHSEQELLKSLASNDSSVIEAIYKDNFPAIQLFVLSNNGSSDDAMDLFQEAMILLYEKAVAGDLELNCKLKTYIYSVCRRLWLKRLQQMKRTGNSVETLEDTIPVEEDLEEQERKNEAFLQMEQALSKLGEPCKSLLEAFYIQKKHMNEISEEFGYTNSDNAKNQKYKCLMRLKKIFFNHYKNSSL
jgi:RNA polymerase sigma factor (sigma-70 family)